MPKPVSRRGVIEKLRKLGFDGPYVATRHQFMLKSKHKIFIPNPHGKDIGVPIIAQIIKQVGLTTKEWEDL